MSRFLLLSALLLASFQSACAQAPVMTTLPAMAPRAGFQQVMPPAMPMPAPAAASLLGLQNEEVELSGIYRIEQGQAVMLLRNGESVDLLDRQQRQLQALQGVEPRAMLRVRGLLRTAYQPQPRMGLVVGQVLRV